jgi:predicted nucleic acid-binding protein
MDSVQLVIDTDIIIDFLRHKSKLLQEAVEKYNCGITAVSLYELQAIAVRSPRQEELLAEFLTIIAVLPFDQSSATSAAQVWRDLQLQGQGIGLPDTLIAGICLANDVPLLTNNQKHFQRVINLKLIDSVDIS